ncbi:hypothetical protein ACFPYN_02990 [Paenisporosarcina macmurdoensis]|uniref:Tetratricopeptide repeat protein n=1 Tax=Paenisporosarcina macmurdoensis TaxID=212659 RepID=A0ABW1L2Z1_9BACL
MDFKKLREDLSSITDIIYFDSNQYLREKSSNLSKLKQFIIKTEVFLEQIKEDALINKEEKYFLYGTLGNLYRIYGEPKISINYLELNLKYAIEEKLYKKEIISLIRLGEALKYDNKLEEALEKFNLALVRCEETDENSHLDFAFQHKGKCLLELNRLEDAMNCFQSALELRKSKGNSSLIYSTEQAIEFAQNIQN